jgi:hypothetical protein
LGVDFTELLRLWRGRPDELTDVSYRSHGFFVNMIGKF